MLLSFTISKSLLSTTSAVLPADVDASEDVSIVVVVVAVVVVGSGDVIGIRFGVEVVVATKIGIRELKFLLFSDGSLMSFSLCVFCSQRSLRGKGGWPAGSVPLFRCAGGKGVRRESEVQR